jgi:hypothetical protein
MAKHYDTKLRKWVDSDSKKDEKPEKKPYKWKSLGKPLEDKPAMGFSAGIPRTPKKHTYRTWDPDLKMMVEKEYTYTSSSYDRDSDDNPYWWRNSTDQGNYYDSFKKEKGVSASSYWSKRFTGDSWYSYSGDDRQYRYRAALRSVARSANIVSNAIGDGKERLISVRWSNNESKNNLKDKFIYLSPDVINKKACRQKEWEGDELTDVLVAQALSESKMKVTASALAHGRVSRTNGDTRKAMTEALWYASELVTSRDTVLEKYPGFKGYFASHLAYYSNEEVRKEIEKELEKGKPNSITATKAVLWNLLHPTDHIENIPDHYREVIDQVEERIGDADSSIDRAKAAIDGIESFHKLWPIEEVEQEEGEEPEEGDSDLPSFEGLGMDRDSMSDKVDNKTDQKLAIQSAEDTDEDGNPIDPDHSMFDDVYNEIITHQVKSDSNTSKIYLRKVRELQHIIRALRDRLKFRNEVASIHEKGLRKGALDEGSLFKLGFHPAGFNDPRVFEREEIPERHNSAFVLLVDESGSMGGRVNRRSWAPHEGDLGGGIRSEIARDTAIVLAEALEDVLGTDLSVLGHTGECGGHGRSYAHGVLCHHYLTPENPHKETIIKMSSFGQNLDGFAIKHAVKMVRKWYPDHRDRYVIHISDGQPAGSGYGGHLAFAHMRQVSRDAALTNVKVLGLCIGPSFTESRCIEMYGETNYVILNSIASAYPAIANLIVRTAGKAAQL